MSRRNRRRESGTMTDDAERMVRPGNGNPDASRSEQGSPPANWREQDEQMLEGQMDSASRFVSEHPIAAMVAGFGAGVGFGLLAVALFRPERESRWYERLAPPSLDELSSGLKKLPEKAARYLPEAMSWR